MECTVSPPNVYVEALVPSVFGEKAVKEVMKVK